MPLYPAVVSLADLNGTNGFEIRGLAENDLLGSSVSFAGDINGDGFDDIVLVSQHHNTPSPTPMSDYVIFGRAGGFGANFDLATLNGSNGFRVDGLRNQTRAYSQVSSAGDINGDGFDDFILGSPYTPNSSNQYPDREGAAYVVFGKAGGFAPSFDIALLNGSNGFRLDGFYQVDRAGFAVSSAGDINGDGFDDLLVAAPYGRHAQENISTYVIFGKAGGFNASMDLKDVDGVNGFRIRSATNDFFPGYSVSSAGDVNGDGFDDIIIGNKTNAGTGTSNNSVVVVFGRANGFGATLDLATLPASGGFRLVNLPVGQNTPSVDVSSAGDINADGFADLIVGSGEANALTGASYVVFGKAGGFGTSVDVAALNGTNGFRLTSPISSGELGFSVSSAGDVNGDGFDDILVGAPSQYHGDAAGSTYVVFGKASGFSSTFDLATLNGDNGFRIDGGQYSYKSGISVSGAGDLNGDGFDDILIGAKEAETGGVSRAGAAYVVYGHAPDGAVDRTGTAIANKIMGGTFADKLSGLGGNDTLDGGAGADTLTGGLGNDTFYVDNAGDKVVEASGQGTDTVHTKLASYTLADNVERLYFDDVGAHTGKGNVLNNLIYGNAGLDKFLIDAGGKDTFSGGAGEDTFDGRSATNGMVLRLDAQANNAGSVAGDAFASIEKFFGSNTAADAMTTGAARAKFFGYGGDDTLTGGSSIDALSGGAGNDSLVGNGGQDALDGGVGNDTMTGGAAADTFTFVDAAFGKDVITDFEDGIDRLKVFSAVADNFSDFTVTGNGSHHVVLTLAGATANTITLDNASANITVSAADFLFY